MIEPNPAWEVLDSSKLSDYLTCPRKFFYTHVLGWRPDTSAHDLYFGECWHIAREYMLLNGYEDISGAYSAFISKYREMFDVETDDLYRPKDPVAVAMAIRQFADEKPRDLIDNEVLFTEISGTVPIDFKGRRLHYRMDSVLRRKEDGKIFSWDHKSTKRFSTTWSNQFFLSIQNGTYTHCLYCLHPINQVLGIEFCGTCFEYLKRGSKARDAGYHITLQRVPAFKTPDQMNAWLWTVNNLYDDVTRDFDRLSNCTEDDAVLMAFQMNPESCGKYWGCIFHDFCISWPNPLQRAAEPPLGFREEFWDPRNMKTTNKMDLEWKGGE